MAVGQQLWVIYSFFLFLTVVGPWLISVRINLDAYTQTQGQLGAQHPSHKDVSKRYSSVVVPMGATPNILIKVGFFQVDI